MLKNVTICAGHYISLDRLNQKHTQLCQPKVPWVIKTKCKAFAQDKPRTWCAGTINETDLVLNWLGCLALYGQIQNL